MSKKNVFLCKGMTIKKKRCRNKVKIKGEYCTIHRSNKASIITVTNTWLMILTVCSILDKIDGTLGGLDKVKDIATNVINYLGPFLMPEDFWHHGAYQKNKDRMTAELSKAKKSQQYLIGKLSNYNYKDIVRIYEKFHELETELNKMIESGQLKIVNE